MRKEMLETMRRTLRGQGCRIQPEAGCPGARHPGQEAFIRHGQLIEDRSYIGLQTERGFLEIIALIGQPIDESVNGAARRFPIKGCPTGVGKTRKDGAGIQPEARIDQQHMQLRNIVGRADNVADPAHP